jgi:Tol biopolymer transport system component
MRTGGGYAGSPQWSPDGTQLAYGCQPPGVSDDVCIRDTRTGAVTTIVESKTHWEHPVGWSADGQYILVNYNENTSDSRDELYVWSTKTRTLTPFVKTAGVVRGGKFSPDSRLVAYSSTETGRAEVFVTTFPERRQTWQLTTEGGRLISWGLNGKEILVGSLSRHIMAYPVETKGGTFVSGSPQTLIRNVGYDVQYATATPDHSRILIRVPKDADKDKGEIRLLFGWANGLK